METVELFYWYLVRRFEPVLQFRGSECPAFWIGVMQLFRRSRIRRHVPARLLAEVGLTTLLKLSLFDSKQICHASTLWN
jgi:hypothetical protein